MSFLEIFENRQPMVHIRDFETVDSRLALVNDDFADDMSGWDLVHIRGARGTYYEPFTTDEVLFATAETYGGLSKEMR